MATKFDYKKLLGVSDDSYDVWSDQVEEIETRKLREIKSIAGDINLLDEDEVKEYCEESVLVEIFGQDMSPTILKVRRDRLKELQASFKYC